MRSLTFIATALSWLPAATLAMPTGALYAPRLPRDFGSGAEAKVELLEKRAAHELATKRFEEPTSHKTMNPVENTTTAPYPIYRAITDFDYASFNLGLYQEYIELDLFNHGLAKYSDADFDAAGVNAQYREFIRFMAQQEVAHAELLSNILGPGAAQSCSYTYPDTDVRSFLDLCQRVTRFGESGVWGFLTKLNSQDSGQLLSQSIATEARQQMAFRQMLGAPAMPVAFESGIPQTWAWTLLAPYITSCPKANPRVMWSNFPALNFTPTTSLVAEGSQAALWTNETALLEPKMALHLSWEKPGKKVGPDGSYTTVRPSDKAAKWAAHVTHLNVTWTELFNVTETSAVTYIPSTNPAPLPGVEGSITLLNGTNFMAVTSEKIEVSAYNLTKIDDVLVAGPAIVQYG